MLKLDAKELRAGKVTRSVILSETKDLRRNEIYIILDNVLDTYNVGSIFRLADAVAAKKIYLCGQTEIPPNTRIKKASINTTEWVEWEYCETAVEAIGKLRKLLANRSKNTRIEGSLRDIVRAKREHTLNVVAIEQSTKSVPYDKFEYTLPICLIVGNETTGVSKEVLKMCHGIVELPMFGVNKSLNVMVSLGIVLYKVISDIS